MALDTASERNFNTRNPEEALRLIENLASSNNTKNTDFERKKSAAMLGKEKMDEVRAKLDSVHKLLKKQVCLMEAAKAVDEDDREAVEEDVNYISGTGFRGLETREEHMNFYGQISNFQNSQYQKSYKINYSNNMNYGNSSYQNPPLPTQESKIEAMLDQVLEGKQKLTVDFNGRSWRCK